MSIRREDLAQMDFSDVTSRSGKRLPALHPGSYLAEILDETGVSQAEFARVIGVSPMRVSHVIKGTRSVTAEMALRFAHVFDQSPQYWMNLQVNFDLSAAAARLGKSGVATRTRTKTQTPA